MKNNKIKKLEALAKYAEDFENGIAASVYSDAEDDEEFASALMNYANDKNVYAHNTSSSSNREQVINNLNFNNMTETNYYAVKNGRTYTMYDAGTFEPLYDGKPFLKGYSYDLMCEVGAFTSKKKAMEHRHDAFADLYSKKDLERRLPVYEMFGLVYVDRDGKSHNEIDNSAYCSFIEADKVKVITKDESEYMFHYSGHTDLYFIGDYKTKSVCVSSKEEVETLKQSGNNYILLNPAWPIHVYMRLPEEVEALAFDFENDGLLVSAHKVDKVNWEEHGIEYYTESGKCIACVRNNKYAFDYNGALYRLDKDEFCVVADEVVDGWVEDYFKMTRTYDFCERWAGVPESNVKVFDLCTDEMGNSDN